jgi:hypothetical protein
MKTALCFLMAARRREIAELQQLARTSELVKITGRLIHGLQRERGLSNLYLAGDSGVSRNAWQAQGQACLAMEQDLRTCLDALDTQAGHRAQLFSCIAYVLQGLDALPHLRQQVLLRHCTHQRATAAYVKLVAGLLSVVFEAADSAADPEVSRLLVALFNHMQCKEFSGQERATGTAMLASGRAHAASQQRLLHLIESQDRCMQVFHDFATPDTQALARQWQDTQNMAELERLRRIACTASDASALDTQLSPQWFACCSRRIDDMKTVEDRLAQELLALCERKIAAAQHELQTWEQLPENPHAPPDSPPPDAQPLAFFDSPPPSLPIAGAVWQDAARPASGAGVQRSVLDLVHQQSQRLQAMGSELDTVRASLNERKLIERAKGLLMAHRQLSEDDAHKLLRQTAMAQNRRLVEVAEAVLSMADVLPLGQR